MSRVLGLSGLVAALLAAGCNGQLLSGGGGGGGTTPTPTPTSTPVPTGPYAGFVTMGRDTDQRGGTPVESATAQGEFYTPLAGYSPIAGNAYPAAGSCALSGAVGPAPTAGADAGLQITVSGGTDLVLARQPNGGWPFYTAGTLDPAALPVGAAYSFAWPGAAGGIPAESYPAAITMPSEPTVTSPNPTQPVTLSGPLSLTWSGSGSQPLVLLIAVMAGAGNAGIITCSPADTGSFTVPGNLIASLPGGSTGSLTLERVAYQPKVLPDGSVVWLFGVWSQELSARKP